MDTDLGYQLLEKMYFIRLVEEEIADRYNQGQMRCPVHLSIGQEGVPVMTSVRSRRLYLQPGDLARMLVRCQRSHSSHLRTTFQCTSKSKEQGNRAC